jgi:hypothetical protein
MPNRGNRFRDRDFFDIFRKHQIGGPQCERHRLARLLKAHSLRGNQT